MREEALGLKKPLQSLRQTAKDLVAEAAELGVGNASHLLDDVDGVTERLDDLLAKLDDRCLQLKSASTALAQYNVSSICKFSLISGAVLTNSVKFLIRLLFLFPGEDQRTVSKFVGFRTRIRCHEINWSGYENRQISVG